MKSERGDLRLTRGSNGGTAAANDDDDCVVSAIFPLVRKEFPVGFNVSVAATVVEFMLVFGTDGLAFGFVSPSASSALGGGCSPDTGWHVEGTFVGTEILTALTAVRNPPGSPPDSPPTIVSLRYIGPPGIESTVGMEAKGCEFPRLLLLLLVPIVLP